MSALFRRALAALFFMVAAFVIVIQLQKTVRDDGGFSAPKAGQAVHLKYRVSGFGQDRVTENLKSGNLDEPEPVIGQAAFGGQARSSKWSSPVGYSEWYDPENSILFYNKVPKTGSTSLTNIAYSLAKKNGFHIFHLNISKNSHVLSLSDQRLLLENVTNWHQRRPSIVHGHFAFVNFAKFGYSGISYINVVRDPIERLISYYYFLRYGDDFRPHLVRKRFGDSKSFDQCVSDGSPDCADSKLWLQIPFFCGQAVECWKPGSTWALQVGICFLFLSMYKPNSSGVFSI